VSFSDIVLPDRGKRPDDVVREGPEPHEHERRKRDEPRRFDPEKRDDEPGETGDDQPQLHVRETPGVEGRSRPDGHELRHRTHDRDTDPPG